MSSSQIVPAPFKLAIDASRALSGGAVSHITGVIGAAIPEEHGIEQIHVWSYPGLLDQLPDRPWLVRHTSAAFSGGLPAKLWWQRRHLPREVEAAGCTMTLNVDAGTVSTHRPAITISQDMLSYEPGEMQRYAWGRLRLRLQLLRWVQNRSLTYGEGAIFLTRHAAEVIQQACGKIPHVAIVPHGVNERFRGIAADRQFPAPGTRPVRCLYVSNADLYKHQWHVIRAIRQLRDEGRDIELVLAGGGVGTPARMIEEEIAASDPRREFVEWLPFLTHEQLANLYTTVDLVIFASSCENMPITLIEGMASGLPIVCSDRGPMPEVLRDGGEYFDPENPQSIANAVAAMIDDAGRREASRRLAQEYASAFNWKRCAHETLAFIARRHAEIFAGPPAPGRDHS